MASKTTKEEMESELLELIKRHCSIKRCPLAGRLSHLRREIVRSQMPSVYDYLHYRIIDLTTFHAMVERWSPPETWVEKGKYLDNIMQAKYRSNPNGNEAHRAMYNVERGIEMLKLFKPYFATF